jgi:hypothetical protein
MFNRAPVAFRCTRISFDRARRVSGTRAPDLAILVLLSSVVGTMNIGAHDSDNGEHHTVCGKVGDAPDSITLYFDIGTEHLSNERFQAAEFDD